MTMNFKNPEEQDTGIPHKALTLEESYIFDTIVAARKIQTFLWGFADGSWGLEEWRRMFVKRYVKIERIVSDGHASPEGFWYDQEQNEWVLLVAGSAVLSIEKETGIEQIELVPGDYLLIPAHQRHRVESTSKTEKTIWLAVFYPQ